MALELSRKHLTTTCEQVEVWGYKILSNRTTGGTGVAITLPPSKVREFLTTLAQLLTDEGRKDDAEDLTLQVITNPRGRAIAATWLSATLTD